MACCIAALYTNKTHIIKKSIASTVVFLKSKGIPTTAILLNAHVTQHSSYIPAAKKIITDKLIKGVAGVDKLQFDANEVLQDIINIGGRNINTGDMDVSDRLLIFAVKEQRERKSGGTLQDILDSLNRSRFGEVLEGEVKEPLQLQDAQKQEKDTGGETQAAS